MRKISIALALLLGASPPALAQVGNLGNAAAPLNALTNSAVSIKAAPGQVVTVSCGNANAAIEYLQFYDTTGAVVVGTTVAKFSLPLPVSNSFSFYLNANFVKGIQVAATTTPTGGSAPGVALNCVATFR